MQGEKIVYLLVGQRGAGKSFYANKIVSRQPEVVLISRDAIRVKLFGTTHLDHYNGQSEHSGKVTRRLLRLALLSQTNSKIILDYWTGDSCERRVLNQWLRKHGATKVVALYFMTAVEFVSDWFWKKPGIAKIKEMRTRPNEGLSFFSELAPTRDYYVFHQFAAGIALDGFDEVIKINPVEEPVITL